MEPGRWARACAPLLQPVLLALFGLTALSSCSKQGPRGSLIAVPAYFQAGPPWRALNEAAPAVGMAIVNPSNGTGATPEPGLVQAVGEARASGLVVLGYVATGYGRRPVAEVVAEIDRYRQWYEVGGVFLDEASSSCTDLAYYSTVSDQAKAGGAPFTIVLNPGNETAECFMGVADVIVTFEGDHEAYVTRYRAPDWVAGYTAARFWHLIYGTPTVPQMQRAVRLARSRGVGWIYVTPDSLPNPWGRLPDGPYWEAQLAAVQKRGA